MSDEVADSSNLSSPSGDRGLGNGRLLNVGILGLGEGRSTISAALQSKKVHLKMICDKNLEACRQRADEFKVYEYTTDYQEMLDDAEIDIIATHSTTPAKSR